MQRYKWREKGVLADLKIQNEDLVFDHLLLVSHKKMGGRRQLDSPSPLVQISYRGNYQQGGACHESRSLRKPNLIVYAV